MIQMQDVMSKAMPDFREGSIIKGQILEVRPREVLVDIGYKSEGVIPLSEFERRLTELPRSGALVFHCHSGGRSAHAAQLAKAAGFENVYNLEGGIDAWSVEIDPAVLRY